MVQERLRLEQRQRLEQQELFQLLAEEPSLEQQSLIRRHSHQRIRR